jgi:hypothetical protein
MDPSYNNPPVNNKREGQNIFYFIVILLFCPFIPLWLQLQPRNVVVNHAEILHTSPVLCPRFGKFFKTLRLKVKKKECTITAFATLVFVGYFLYVFLLLFVWFYCLVFSFVIFCWNSKYCNIWNITCYLEQQILTRVVEVGCCCLFYAAF